MVTITEVQKGDAVQPSLKHNQNTEIKTNDHDVECWMYVMDPE